MRSNANVGRVSPWSRSKGTLVVGSLFLLSSRSTLTTGFSVVSIHRTSVPVVQTIHGGDDVSTFFLGSGDGGAARMGRKVPIVPRLGMAASADEDESSDTTTTRTKGAAPVLNGKRVLPYKVLMGGLQGHPNVPGVFAILNKEYQRGTEGWDHCEHIGVAMDLEAALTQMMDAFPNQVAHIRALSFAIPVEGAMQSIADDWRVQVLQAGGKINVDPVAAAMEMPYEDEDDDDDDFDEDDASFMEMTAEAMAMVRASPPAGTRSSVETAGESDGIVSPFEMPKPATITTSSEEKMAFTKENVDKVLDEVRPYLISDGGNVSVERVDDQTRNVYLKLEGACGSCPSSTVTMQMGIERVLKEKFENLGQVLQVEEDDDTPKELSYEMVAAEVNRINPAIIAMGGSVEIVNVDGESGVVELKFKGAQKVRSGVELAIRDIGFVQDVKFIE